MSDSQRVCRTCMYWVIGEGGVLGECRRRPPRVMDLEDRNFPSAFPETYDICWCGEWAEGRHLMTPNEQAIAGKQAN